MKVKNLVMYLVEFIVLITGFVLLWWKISLAHQYIDSGVKMLVLGTLMQGIILYAFFIFIAFVLDKLREGLKHE